MLLGPCHCITLPVHAEACNKVTAVASEQLVPVVLFQIAAMPPALTSAFFLSTLKFRVLAYACNPQCQI